MAKATQRQLAQRISVAQSSLLYLIDFAQALGEDTDSRMSSATVRHIVVALSMEAGSALDKAVSILDGGSIVGFDHLEAANG